MLRTLLTFIVHLPWPSRPPCCGAGARARRWALLGLLGLLALLPLVARPQPSAPRPEIVAEALFLCDPLPPGGRDLNLSVTVAPDDAGAAALVPRTQLAVALGDRLGLTADVAFDASSRSGLAAPGASLKALLRDPVGGRLGVGASLDLVGIGTLAGTESALGLGLLAPVGRVTLRGSASVATPLGTFAPHLHAGGSAALALGARLRLLGEVILEAGDGRAACSVGPTVKVALDDSTSLTAGALVDLGRPGAVPSFAVQLGRAM
jgi:hypothetical protein